MLASFGRHISVRLLHDMGNQMRKLLSVFAFAAGVSLLATATTTTATAASRRAHPPES